MTVRHTRRRCAAGAPSAIDDADERSSRASPSDRGAAAHRALRADRPPPPADRHRARVATVRQRVQVPARRATEHRRPARPPPSAATSATVVIPRPCSLRGGDRPDAPQRSTGSGCRNSSSPSGGTSSRPSGFATSLATLARNFVRATPTVIGSPTCSQHRRAQPAGDLDRRARDAAQPADVEEGLVDREPLDERRRVLEHREHRLARVEVRVDPRRDDHGVRAQPPRLPPAHRAAHAERLGLVARGEDDAAADDHRAAAQRRVVALLDGRVERVEVGVEDVRVRGHERMFASLADGSGVSPRAVARAPRPGTTAPTPPGSNLARRRAGATRRGG